MRAMRRMPFAAGRTAVAVVLAVAGFSAWAPPAAAQGTPEPGRTYTIGFSQIVDHPALNATRQGFLDGLKEAGFEEGKNLVLEYQNAQGDVGTARSIAERFIAGKVDLLAPCTTPVVLATIRAARDSGIPVVFGCVTNPVQAGVVETADQPTGSNVTGFYTVPPVGRNFDIFTAIAPGMKRVGTLYNSGESNSEALNKLAREEAEKRGMVWVEAPVTSSAEVLTAVQSLVGKVDALVTLQDNTVASAYEAIVKTAEEAGLPWFSFDVQAVERGAIAALAQDQYQNGVDWAKKAAVPVLLGADAGAIVPVEAEIFEIQLNADAAKAAGLAIPEAIRAKASRVHGG
ncbi:ABC transporter substrate-binding protein [Faunimonas sp. B44]